MVNGTLAKVMGTSGETCVWGWPVLNPAPRPTDNWGIGWTKLHEIEVMEIETADITEVGLSCWPHVSTSASGVTAKSGIWRCSC